MGSGDKFVRLGKDGAGLPLDISYAIVSLNTHIRVYNDAITLETGAA